MAHWIGMAEEIGDGWVWVLFRREIGNDDLDDLEFVEWGSAETEDLVDVEIHNAVVNHSEIGSV